MPFKKYPSIENYYRHKFIKDVTETYPELRQTQYVIQEKIDGSNISLVFTPHEEMKICSRNYIVDKGFNGVGEILDRPEFQEFIKFWQAVCEYDGITYNFFGEIFGKGIQNRVNYGDNKYIRFFDMAIDGIIQPPSYFYIAMYNNKFEDLMVPFIDIVDNLESALNVSTEFTTCFNPTNGTLVEGVVIKPLNNVYFWNNEIFYLKKKNDRFIETTAKVPKETNPTVDGFRTLYRTYINKNRILSVFSKEGEIQNQKDIGKYIKLIMEDVLEDFVKDNPEFTNLDKATQREVTKIGGQLIVPILNEFL